MKYLCPIEKFKTYTVSKEHNQDNYFFICVLIVLKCFYFFKMKFVFAKVLFIDFVEDMVNIVRLYVFENITSTGNGFGCALIEVRS